MSENTFKLVGISENKNSFGLNKYIFVSPSGEAWEGLTAREYCSYEEGALLTLPEDRACGLSRLSFECPHQRTNAPAKCVEEIWSSELSKA